MEDSIYDEFGNYIGPELSGSEEVLTGQPFVSDLQYRYDVP